MKMRVKYDINGTMRYVLQTKNWLFWKTIAKFSTLENVEEFLKKLKKVDDFNESLNESGIKFKIPVRVIYK